MFSDAIQPIKQTVMRLGDIGRAAVDVLEAAETSDFDHVVIENSFRSHENSFEAVHGQFAQFRKLFESVAADAGVSVEGQGQEGSPPSISGLTAVELATEAKRVAREMGEAIPDAARIGAGLIDEMNRISLRENMGEDERSDLMGDLVSQAYHPFCEAVHQCFGLVGGVVRRVGARAAMSAGSSIQVSAGKTDDDIGVLPPSLSKAVVESLRREDTYGKTAPAPRLSSFSRMRTGFMTEEWWRGMNAKVTIPGAKPVYASNVVEAARIKARNPGAAIIENDDETVPPYLVECTDLEERLPWASTSLVPKI